jgi:hypothetical protein
MKHSGLINYIQCYPLLKLRLMNFTDYWKQNKELFEQLNVSEAAAKKIWNDCADNVMKKITDHYLGKLK